MPFKPASSLSPVQISMLALGALTVVFIWALFVFNLSSARSDTLAARQAEHRNLALIVSESLKQMTDRARAMASLIDDGQDYDDSNFDRLLTLLADDPVFNRLSLYSAAGALRYASHPGSTHPKLAAWLDQFAEHVRRYGAAPMLPLKGAASPAPLGEPSWRLPFFVPTGLHSIDDEDSVILIELDVGYLAGLIQHIELGDKGFIQVLDADGREWMRADTSGVIVGGTPVPRIRPAMNGRVSSGQAVFEVNEQTYQTVFVTRPAHGFTVSVSEPYSEILGPLRSNQNKQLVINILMTLVVAGIVFWLARGLKQQQKVLRALQLSERKNQELIKRLEGEHARSSRAATVDHLSGLFNRRQFLEVAPNTLAEQRRKRSLSALLFIDLDRFKSINDSLGHHVGDLLLQAVAGRIRKMLGPGDAATKTSGGISKTITQMTSSPMASAK
ncbi:MAG: diguanylate cyclase, partial [Marinobacter sp.]